MTQMVSLASLATIGAFAHLLEEPRSSPVPLRGRGSARGSPRGSRGTRRSQVQEASILGVTKRGNRPLGKDAVATDQNEPSERADSNEEDSDVGKRNPGNTPNVTSANTRKRRSVRRR